MNKFRTVLDTIVRTKYYFHEYWNEVPLAKWIDYLVLQVQWPHAKR